MDAPYLNVLDDEGRLQTASLDSIADMLNEAGLELELQAPKLSWSLFRTARELRRTVGIVGAPLDPAAPVCLVGPLSMRDKARFQVCLVSPCPECGSAAGGQCNACTV